MGPWRPGRDPVSRTRACSLLNFGGVESASETARRLAARSFVAVAELGLCSSAGLYAVKLAAGSWEGTELADSEADDPDALAYVGKAQRGGGAWPSAGGRSIWPSTPAAARHGAAGWPCWHRRTT
jgi:hypothetical protein